MRAQLAVDKNCTDSVKDNLGIFYSLFHNEMVPTLIINKQHYMYVCNHTKKMK